MSDLPPTPGAGASTPGPEPAPGAPAEPTTGSTASATTDSDAGGSTASGSEPVSAESAAAPSGPTPPGGPLDGDPTATSSTGTSSAAPGAASAEETGRPNRRKVREGLVLSVAMDKTAVVGVVDRVRHPRYVKTVQRTKRLYAHDESNQLRVGDRVRVAETRPMSRLKRWRIVEVLERAK